MNKFDCMKCVHAFYEPEYPIPFGNEDVVTEMFLCDNSILKDLYYNGTGKTRVGKGREVESSKQAPIPIGEICWTCRGKHYIEDDEQSIYDIM